MRASNAQPRRTQRAFTLVEVICTMAVLAVIGVLSSRLIFAASDQYLAAASRSAIGAELAATMELLATHIRQIPPKTGVSPTQADLGAISSTSLAWVGADGVARVIARSGSTLAITEGAATYTLLADVSSFAVRTFDEANTLLPSSLAAGATAAVRRIELSVTVTRQGEAETLRSKFFLRCTVEGGSP